MSTSMAGGLTFAIILFALGVLAIGLCRVSGRASRDEELGELTVWDFTAERWVHLPPGAEPGPGQMTRRQIERTPGMELSYRAPGYGEKELAALDAGLTQLFEELGPPPARKQEGESA